MKIVVLDGYAANPGDLSWERLGALGHLTVHDRTGAGEVLDRAAHAEVLITNKTVLSGETLRQLPTLRYLGLLSTGANVIDLEVAKELGIPVCNVPAYSTPSVVQLTFGLLFELVMGIGLHSARSSEWPSHSDFAMPLQPLTELAGKTFGSIGYGEIGRGACGVARALGMNTLATRRLPNGQEADEIVTIERLKEEADVISLHCPLTPETHGLVNAEFLAGLKRGALLLNTARGPLVDELAVAESVGSGHLGGYGTDVLCQEPPRDGSPLLNAPRCVVTPHIAWATREARERLLDVVAENVRMFLAGTCQNRVA